MKTCANCDGPVSAHPAAKFCMEPECRKARNRERMRKFYAERPTYRNKYRPLKSPTNECVDCGKRLKYARLDQPRCRECAPKWACRPRPALALRRRAERLASKAAAGSAGSSAWTTGNCDSCGAAVCRKGGGGYCSRRCSRRELNARRRARESGVKITPGRRVATYERDDWCCQICGEPTDREAKVPQRLAPTIDHIIPLAAGGPHSPENWQTAHFICNSRKRDLTAA